MIYSIGLVQTFWFLCRNRFQCSCLSNAFYLWSISNGVDRIVICVGSVIGCYKCLFYTRFLECHTVPYLDLQRFTNFSWFNIISAYSSFLLLVFSLLSGILELFQLHGYWRWADKVSLITLLLIFISDYVDFLFCIPLHVSTFHRFMYDFRYNEPYKNNACY